jgi:transcriptional regulator with XRE-family HTH domain
MVLRGYNNLKAELKRKGLKQEDVANVLRVTSATANHKINGRYPFTLIEAFEVRNALFPDIDIAYLFETQDESRAI